MRVTRRGIQITLGALWLLDGALQLQPFMFGHGFADQIIAPAGQGQPGFVSAGVGWAAATIAAHPVALDTLFAVGQLALGVGLLVRTTARVALGASIAWALGVWFFGEGLGGLGSGHADLLTGAPGAVLLYAVLAAAAWPSPLRLPRVWTSRWSSGQVSAPPARWVAAAWAVLWVGAGLLRALPGQGNAAALADEVGGNADAAPGWLAHLDNAVASALHGTGLTVVVALVLVEIAIGAAGLVSGGWRSVAVWAGVTLSAAFWVLGQSVGELYTGQATDPNTAPLVVLLALALRSVLSLPEVESGQPSADLSARQAPMGASRTDKSSGGGPRRAQTPPIST